MIVAASFSLVVILHLTAAIDQTPTVTQCPGQNRSVVEIQHVVVSDAKLGKKIKLDGTVLVKKVAGKHPVLQLSFSTPDGKNLTCDPSVLPCTLNLCDGTTRQEKELNKDWGNTCPVPPGTYSTHLSFRLPKGPEAEALFGVAGNVTVGNSKCNSFCKSWGTSQDGSIIIKFNIVDGNKVLGCASIPVTIDVD